MGLLALNYGSVTLKWALFEGGRAVRRESLPCQEGAMLEAALSEILAGSGGRLRAIVHRVVHGGGLTETTLITESVLGEIERATRFSPIHNRRALLGIRFCSQWNLPQIAVFDTAFHASLPPAARLYALPLRFAEEGLRRYGFHGISYSYLVGETARRLGKSPSGLNAILLHLGGGASICAVERGRSVETSMGLTPLEGLVMDTRSGDLDPGLLLHLMDRGWSVDRLEELLTQASGLKGLTGTTDFKEIVGRAKGGEEPFRLALQLYTHRIRKYLGAYFAVLKGRVDAVVFSGGIGQNSPELRALVCRGLEPLGLLLDERRNRENREEISQEGSPVRLFALPTDEELEMVRQAQRLLENNPP